MALAPKLYQPPNLEVVPSTLNPVQIEGSNYVEMCFLTALLSALHLPQ